MKNLNDHSVADGVLLLKVAAAEEAITVDDRVLASVDDFILAERKSQMKTATPTDSKIINVNIIIDDALEKIQQEHPKVSPKTIAGLILLGIDLSTIKITLQDYKDLLLIKAKRAH